MAVYVDDMAAPYKPKHRPGVTYVMCHMIATTDDELHAMAKRIGVARRWYQRDHYDITKGKRREAVTAGAVEITQRQLACLAWLKRMGLPLCEPALAEITCRAEWRKIRDQAEGRGSGRGAGWFVK